MKKAIGYIRVSTEQQVDEGVSLDAQRVKIKAWCELNDCELVAIYEDAGISGKSINKREGLQQTLACMNKDMVLVVYSLSRLARTTKNCIEIADELRRKNCDLVSLTEKIDTSTAMGEFFFTLIAALGQMERKLIAERTKAALSHKKYRGEKYGTVPFGYSAIEGRLVAVQSESMVVASILKQRKAGKTLVGIAEYLNAHGIKGKKGGRWHASTVRYLINRQAA